MASTRYQVTILPSGERFECRARQPILTAAHAANVLMPYSCRNGQCGACLGRLIVGEVYYPDGQPDALSDALRDKGFALFCSARAASDLVIEQLPPEF